MLERLLLSLFKFNQWEREFLNLRCSTHVNNTLDMTLDMRVVYAMHANFLASAPLSSILEFVNNRSRYETATRWALQMMRFYSALLKTKGRPLRNDHAVLVGTDTARIQAADPENIVNELKFYYKSKQFTDTPKYMKKIRNCIMTINERVLPEEDHISDGEDGDGDTFWGNNHAKDLSVDIMERLLRAVKLGKNTRSVILSYSGQIIRVKQALRAIHDQAARAGDRETRSSTRNAGAEPLNGKYARPCKFACQ